MSAPIMISVSDTTVENIKRYYKESGLNVPKKNEMEKVINNMIKEHIYDLECAKDIIDSEKNDNDNESYIDLGTDEDDLKGILSAGRA
jgi:hypothetical protein